MSAAGRRPRWWEADPARLTWELAQLAERGTFAVDDNELAAGRLVVRGSVAVREIPRVVAIVFPDTYPEHRCELFEMTDDDLLPLHQEPYGRRLCLIDNDSRAWTPQDFAGWMVDRYVQLRDAASTGIDAVRDLSVDAPEPVSAYYPYGPDTSMLVPSALLDCPGDHGTFRCALLSSQPVAQGLLAQVRGAGSELRADDRLVIRFAGPALDGPWFRLEERPPFLNSSDEFARWASENVPSFQKRFAESAPPTSLNNGSLRLRAFGLVYPDDGPKGKHNQWMLIIQAVTKEKELLPPRWVDAAGAIVRPFILDDTEQSLRVPALEGVRGKAVGIVGLGTVGAPIGLELGRIGTLARMVLVDFDFFSIWNMVRHPLDLQSLGRNKAQALGARIGLAAPFTDVVALPVRIGDAAPPGADMSQLLRDEDVLARLQECDLVIDASADAGTTRVLNRWSLEYGIPLLVVTVTEGGWGGEVVCSRPGSTGCYECYLWDVREGKHIVAQDPAGTRVFTRGCGFPSFTGAGFDATSIAADAARIAVQVLSQGKNEYPPPAADILIRHNRGSTGEAISPSYRHERLEINPRCACHGEQSRAISGS